VCRSAFCDPRSDHDHCGPGLCRTSDGCVRPRLVGLDPRSTHTNPGNGDTRRSRGTRLVADEFDWNQVHGPRVVAANPSSRLFAAMPATGCGRAIPIRYRPPSWRQSSIDGPHGRIERSKTAITGLECDNPTVDVIGRRNQPQVTGHGIGADICPVLSAVAPTGLFRQSQESSRESTRIPDSAREGAAGDPGRTFAWTD
jgi:hypothetical protein